MVVAGWIITGILALFLLGASVAPKLIGASVAGNALTEIGWSPSYMLMIGLIELGCTILYVIPKTSLLGAILMTGLLGGAMASHIRADSPLFSHILFSVYLGLFMWVGLWLRSEQLRSVFPLLKS
jgi:hypothetical protein